MGIGLPTQLKPKSQKKAISFYEQFAFPGPCVAIGSHSAENGKKKEKAETPGVENGVGRVEKAPRKVHGSHVLGRVCGSYCLAKGKRLKKGKAGGK